MRTQLTAAVPEERQDAVSAALSHAFGQTPIQRIEPGPRGASGASTFRIHLDHRDEPAFLLRVEGPRSPLRNPHQYVCLQLAADAGIAPPIRFVDAEAGVVVMGWIQGRPLDEFPGGPPALAGELGRLVRRLQQTPVFPQFRDYATVIERLLSVMRGKCLPGLLDQHTAAFAELRAAYPWDAEARVSSHNDLNPHNVLFDGQRLWLIDWETAYRNDPFVDLATAAEQCAKTSELEERLLEAWSGARAESRSLARLRVMRVLTRLYYAGLLLMAGTAGSQEAMANLSAPSEAEFKERVANGTMPAFGAEAIVTLGKMQLAAFITGAQDPMTAAALRTLVAEG
jgi:thiamine kinase-like enzyme